MSDGAHDRLAAFQFFARINAFQRVLLNTLLHKSIGDRGEHRFCLRHRWFARIRMHGDQKAGKARQAIVGAWRPSISMDSCVNASWICTPMWHARGHGLIDHLLKGWPTIVAKHLHESMRAFQ